MIEKERNLGLDLLRIVECFLIVGIHTVLPSKSVVGMVGTLLSVTAIPMFFLINGYLMMGKKEITYGYVFKKIIRILFVCFMWEFLQAVAYFAYYHELRNFLASFVMDFFQQGLFLHFWFMGALMILYLLCPLLHKMYRSFQLGYILLLCSVCACGIVIDVAMIITGNSFVLVIPQNLRLWYWIFYYMLGGLLANKKDSILSYLSGFSSLKKTIAFLLAILILVIWQWIIGYQILERYIIETHYGSFSVIVMVLLLFIFLGLDYNIKNRKLINFLTPLCMGIYIFHPFILSILKKFVPAFVDGSGVMNLAFWGITYMISLIVTKVVSKIPVVKELVKL